MDLDGTSGLVSVILPTRNRRHSLRASIDSVLSGSYSDLELIVVDDASTDDTASILDEVDDERMTVIALTDRVGAGEARNTGLRRASGAFIAFQDSDDIWGPDHLTKLVGAIEPAPSPVAVAYGTVRYPSGVEVPAESDVVRCGDLRAVLARYNIIGLPAAVVRADAMRSIDGFDTAMRRNEDWDVVLRLAGRHHFVFVHGVVLEASDFGERISDDDAAGAASIAMILERHADLYARFPLYRVSYRMQLVYHGFRSGQYHSAIANVLAVCRRPQGLGGWLGERVVRRRSPVGRAVVRQTTDPTRTS